MSITQFLQDNHNTIRTEDSRRCYRQKLQQAERALGPLLEASGPDLARFLTSQDWAPQTVRSYKVALVGFYRWALRSGTLDRDPTVHLDQIRPPARGVRKHHWLSPAQVHKLIEACPAGLLGCRDRAALATFVFTGLRVRELTQIRWAHVHTDKGVIHVHGKGEKHAEVGISVQLNDELQRWRTEQVIEGFNSGGDDPLIPALHRRFQSGPQGRQQTLTMTSRAISVKQLRRLVTQAGQRIDIAGLAPHDLRRTLAGLLEDRGVPLEHIQKVLRHSSVATTQRYLSDNPTKAAEVLRGFEL